MSIVLGQIGYFHLTNLTRNKVPFVFLGIDFSPPTDLKGELRTLMAPLQSVASGQFFERVAALQLKADHPIVLLCREGAESSRFHRELEAKGFLNVYVVQGGWTTLLAESLDHPMG
jgi:rhodanese-related sulfurtransferase